MAQVGKKYKTIAPASRTAGFPEVAGVGRSIYQASSETYLAGAPVYINASGVVKEGASHPLTIYGFARIPADNTATDGAKGANVYKAHVGQLFQGTLSGTWSSSFMGVKGMLTKDSSSWLIQIITADSDSYDVLLQGPAPNQNWAAGDSFIEVLFTVLDTKIQGDATANVAS